MTRNPVAALVVVGLMLGIGLQLPWSSDDQPPPPGVVKNASSETSRVPAALLGSHTVATPVSWDDPAAVFVDEPRSSLSLDLLEAVRRMSAQGDTVQARQLLVRAAARAVENQDQQRLIWVLNWLGRVNIVAGDLRNARVHVEESLKIAERLGHDEGIANAKLQLGRVEQGLREQARRAGEANDLLHLGRTLRGKGNTAEATESLLAGVELNIELGRAGSAASGLELLADIARRGGSRQRWLDHTREAARQWIRAGQRQHADNLVAKAGARLSDDEQQALQAMFSDEQERYERQDLQRHQVSEYLALYNHFAATGDPTRAWAFRVKANEIRQDDAAEEVYRRKPEVMAVLYSSNENHDSARRYYAEAARYYEGQQPEVASTIYGLSQALR